LIRLDTENFDTILELVRLDTELGELCPHRRDSVALLDPLVCDSSNTSRVRRLLVILAATGERGKGSDSGESRGGKESVGHGFHIDESESSKFSNRRSSDGRFSFGLHDGTSHRFEDVLGEASISLK